MSDSTYNVTNAIFDGLNKALEYKINRRLTKREEEEEYQRKQRRKREEEAERLELAKQYGGSYLDTLSGEDREYNSPFVNANIWGQQYHQKPVPKSVAQKRSKAQEALEIFSYLPKYERPAAMASYAKKYAGLPISVEGSSNKAIGGRGSSKDYIWEDYNNRINENQNYLNILDKEIFDTNSRLRSLEDYYNSATDENQKAQYLNQINEEQIKLNHFVSQRKATQNLIFEWQDNRTKYVRDLYPQQSIQPQGNMPESVVYIDPNTGKTMQGSIIPVSPTLALPVASETMPVASETMPVAIETFDFGKVGNSLLNKFKQIINRSSRRKK